MGSLPLRPRRRSPPPPPLEASRATQGTIEQAPTLQRSPDARRRAALQGWTWPGGFPPKTSNWCKT